MRTLHDVSGPSRAPAALQTCGFCCAAAQCYMRNCLLARGTITETSGRLRTGPMLAVGREKTCGRDPRMRFGMGPATGPSATGPGELDIVATVASRPARRYKNRFQ
jgi:hypothetical protein